MLAQSEEPLGSANGHSPPSIELRRELPELFSCPEDELGFQLATPEC
jgi:hypothetical protein